MTNSLSVSSRMLLSLAMFLESFRGCLGTSSGMEGPSLVNLLSYFPALVQPFSFTDTVFVLRTYFTRVQSSFIKHMHLTRDR